ncbi:MAG: hypothetical protein AAF682_22805 [Planctomycetota bacterium]
MRVPTFRLQSEPRRGLLLPVADVLAAFARAGHRLAPGEEDVLASFDDLVDLEGAVEDLAREAGVAPCAEVFDLSGRGFVRVVGAPPGASSCAHAYWPEEAARDDPRLAALLGVDAARDRVSFEIRYRDLPAPEVRLWGELFAYLAALVGLLAWGCR